MQEFFHMGGYAVYVWSAYGVVAVVLIGLIVWTLAELRGSSAELKDLEALSPRRRRRAGASNEEPTDAQS
jgi:heme exporter protein D